MAALEASVPRKIRISKGSPPAVDVTYAGDPKFETIPGTQVARAVNSGFDVFLYQNRFYLCYAAGWYVGDSPIGPWAATADVPAAIYGIPPDSPSYAVTDVKVTDSSDDDIEYSSTDAYAAGVFLAFGVAYYGTGWYYPPYIYGPFYYPYWGSYGHGSWYNPTTGRYGSRSVWYGPYGGYSFTQGYNPRTGRYGYVETGWDGDEWASFGETYNPRTGIGTQTERYYDQRQESPRNRANGRARRRMGAIGAHHGLRRSNDDGRARDITGWKQRSATVTRGRHRLERTHGDIGGWQHVHHVRRAVAGARLQHDHRRRWIDHDGHRAQ